MAQWVTGGLQILRSDDGYYSSGGANTDYADASQINYLIMASRGYKVISGCEVTAQSTPDFTVQISAGSVFIGGTEYSVSAIGSLDLSSHIPGTSGESRYVMISADGAMSSSSDFNTTDDTLTVGTAATTGNQLRPNVPENHVVLAEVLLTNNMASIGDNSIGDTRQLVKDGQYVNGDIEIPDANSFTKGSFSISGSGTVNIQENSSGINLLAGGSIVIGFDESNNQTDRTFTVRHDGGTNLFQIDETGKIYNPVDNAGLYTGVGTDFGWYHDGTDSYIEVVNKSQNRDLILLNSNNDANADFIYRGYGHFQIQDHGDTGDPTLFDMDLANHTLDIFASGDTGQTNIWGNVGFNTTSIPNVASTHNIITNGEISIDYKNNYLWILDNAYFDSTDGRWEYIKAEKASQWLFKEDRFYFKVADTGTIDGAITWATMFDLDASTYSAPTLQVFNATQTGTMSVHGTLDTLTGLTMSGDIDLGGNNILLGTGWIGNSVNGLSFDASENATFQAGITAGGNVDLAGNGLVTTNDTITNAELEFLHDISVLSKTDGNFIVTNGTTFVAESGNTARTSLGLGTGNSPTFAGMTLTGNFDLNTESLIVNDGTGDHTLTMDQWLPVGSTNARTQGCGNALYDTDEWGESISGSDFEYIMLGTQNTTEANIGFVIPLPTSKAGQTLHVTSAKGNLTTADASNILEFTSLIGFLNGTPTIIDSNDTVVNSTGLFTRTFSTTSCSGYDYVAIYFRPGSGDTIDMKHPSFTYYYT